MPSTIRDGLPPVDYYAPNYRIEVEGREISPTTKGDVVQLTVTMQKDGLTSFNITINNWDDQTLTFKYSDRDTFFIGKRIHIRMGYAQRLVSMVHGQVKSLNVRFPESGAPTLEVSGTDSLNRLKGSRPHDGDRLIYTDHADWQIAQEIARRNDMPINVTQEGPIHPRVVQEKDQDDARFLLDRARRVEFDVYVQTDPQSGEETLNFVKPTDGRDGRPIQVYDFEWGKSLITFSTKLETSKQVTSVTVRGWNPRTKEPIVYTATQRDLPATPGRGTNGPAAAERLTARRGGKRHFIVDAGVLTEDEARHLAISRLRERAYAFITGSGAVIGMPDLRPGQNVNLKRLGQRIDGPYRITKVDHTIGSSGFQTKFDVDRIHEGGAR